jgi:hypothetical protein
MNRKGNLMKKQAKTWNPAEEPALRIERFWPDGRAEATDLDALPGSIDAPNGASTVISLFDPTIDVRDVEALLVAEDEPSPDFDDFFLENLPEEHNLAELYCEAEWEGLELDVKPAVLVPSPYTDDENAGVPFVVVAVPRHADAGAEEPENLAVLLRENGEVHTSALLGSAKPWGEHSWLSEPMDAVTSWDGGASSHYLGPGICATLMWGDLDTNVTIERLPDSSDQTVLAALVQWSADQNLAAWLTLSGGLGGANTAAFTPEELAQLTKCVEYLEPRYVSVKLNVPEAVRAEFDKAVAITPNAVTVQQFLMDPKYPFHAQMLQLLLEAAQNSNPGGILEAGDLEAWLSDSENFEG